MTMISIYITTQKTQYFAWNKFQMMVNNYDQWVGINHSPNWSYILYNPNKILIICSSESGFKTNALLNLIKHQQPNIDKIS